VNEGSCSNCDVAFWKDFGHGQRGDTLNLYHKCAVSNKQLEVSVLDNMAHQAKLSSLHSFGSIAHLPVSHRLLLSLGICIGLDCVFYRDHVGQRWQ